MKRRFVVVQGAARKCLGDAMGDFHGRQISQYIEMVSNGWGCSAWGSKWLGIPMVAVVTPQGIISR